MPATVVVKVEPAIERFACMYSGGWMVLSDSLKILRVEISQPDGLVQLELSLPTDFTPVVGQSVAPQSYNSLLGDEQATAETAGLQASAAQVLDELRDGLETNGLFDGTTALSVLDLSDIKFTYQNRINVKLGSEANLAYKLRLAAAALADPDKGLSGSDKGVLDISTQQSDGEIRAYFSPDEPAPTPTPEPTAAPEPQEETGETTE